MPKPKPDATGIAGTSKLKAPARMLVPLSPTSEQLVRDTAAVTGKTLGDVIFSVSVALDEPVRAACRALTQAHAERMRALFRDEPPAAGNSGTLDPSGAKEG
jgi:hypothetical protein